MESTNFDATADGILVVAPCSKCIVEQRMPVTLPEIAAAGGRPPAPLEELRTRLRGAPIAEIFLSLSTYPADEPVLWVGARCNAETFGGVCGGLIEAVEDVATVQSLMSRAKRIARG